MPADRPRPEQGSRPSPGDPIFDHVLVGIDETAESVIAAAQARMLCAPEGRLGLLAVAETYLATHAGTTATVAADHLLSGTAAALERASELVEPDDARLESGRFVALLCAECERTGATLLAVGVPPHRRLSALTFGGEDVEILHNAPCSVLIARAGWGPSKPERIVVGVDGSPEARAAEAAARSLAGRLGCAIVPVVGLGEGVDVAVLRAERTDALLDPRSLVNAVAGASSERGLVVVGRSPRGRRFAGSVAERVVYSTRCSVLVVCHDCAGAA